MNWILTTAYRHFEMTDYNPTLAVPPCPTRPWSAKPFLSCSAGYVWVISVCFNIIFWKQYYLENMRCIWKIFKSIVWHSSYQRCFIKDLRMPLAATLSISNLQQVSVHEHQNQDGTLMERFSLNYINNHRYINHWKRERFCDTWNILGT